MYIFKPVNDTTLINSLYGDGSSFAYTGYEGNDKLGGCGCTIKGSYVIINKIVFDEELQEFGEGLIRSALNYGANRGAYMAQCNSLNAESIMIRMGFEKNKDGVYEGDIPTLLGGTCSSRCCNLD